jgi:hypothetical protein
MTGEAAIGQRWRRERLATHIGPLVSVAAPVALLVIGLASFAPALVNQDFWLALVSGREVVHGLPHVDHLTVMASGHHWVDQQWLAQLILFELGRIGVGVAAAVCLLCVAAALSIVGLVAHRRGAAPLPIFACLVACIAAAPWSMQFRPQALVLPLFAVTLWLILRDPRARSTSTLWVLPLLCLWANLHGSVVLGTLLVMAYGVQALVRATDRSAQLRALACLTLAPPALLASPYATSLPGYYRLMLLDPPFGREVTEWKQTTPSGLTAVFFVLLACTIVLVAVRRRRLGSVDFIVLGLTGAAGLDALRGIVWFGLACAALLPNLLTRNPGTVRYEGRGADTSAWGAILVTVTALVWVGARPADVYQTRFPRTLAGVVQAKAGAGSTQVFADDASADWLLWKAPSLRGRVAYDVRFELLTRSQISRLLTWDRFEPSWQRVIAGDALVLADPKHISALVATGDWRQVVSSSQEALAERVHRP